MSESISKRGQQVRLDAVLAIETAKVAAIYARPGSALERQAVASWSKHVDAIAASDRAQALEAAKVTANYASSGSVLEQRAVASILKHVDTVAAGDSAVVVGIFRTKGVDKGKKYLNRERFVDTWAKINGTWKCVAAITVLIPAK